MNNNIDVSDMDEFIEQVSFAIPAPNGEDEDNAHNKARNNYKEGKSALKSMSNGLSQYASLGGQGYMPTSSTISILPPDCYNVSQTMEGQIIFLPQKLVTDNLLRLPDSRSDEVVAEVETFWTLKDKFRKFGFAHKRGFLLFGPPGCHAKGTKVMMSDGSLKLVEDVIVGDELMGPDSEPRKVLELRRGRDKMVKVTPTKGESFIVNYHHILHLEPTNESEIVKCPIDISVKDLIENTAKPFKDRFKLVKRELNFKDVKRIGFNLEVLPEEDDYYGFTLNRDHLYLTSDFIVHHNSGKTSTIAIITNDMVKKGGIVLFADAPHVLAKSVAQLRTIEPDRPVVIIMEDIDTIIRSYGEAQVLALLDGEAQIENVVYIATTNYPENLDGRITNRPSRFDRIVKIGLPNSQAREMYLKSRIESTVYDGVDLVEQTEGFSIAHLKELIVATHCQNNPVLPTIERLKKMKIVPKSGSESGTLGIR